MNINKRVMSVVGAVTLAIGLGAGVASAAIPDSSGNVNVCYKTPLPAHGAPLTIIDPETGGSCPNGTTALSLPGSIPPQTAGSTGLGVKIVNTYASPDGANTIDAVCPADHPYVVGGGYWNGGGASVDISGPGIAYTDNGTYPVGPSPEKGSALGASGPGEEQAGPFTYGSSYTAANAWLVRAAASSFTLNVYAVCSK